MRRLLVSLLVGFVCLGLPPDLGAVPTVPATIEVYYSPHGGCTEAITNALQAAQRTVLVQAYSFTSPEIEESLLAAAMRGVKVKLILDRSNLTQKSSTLQKNSKLTDAIGNHLHVSIDAAHEIAHNKVMILDGEIVITGSFNFSRNAEIGNAENLLIIHSKELAASYTANWQEHFDHSDHYERDATGKLTKTEHTKPRKTAGAALTVQSSSRSHDL